MSCRLRALAQPCRARPWRRAGPEPGSGSVRDGCDDWYSRSREHTSAGRDPGTVSPRGHSRRRYTAARNGGSHGGDASVRARADNAIPDARVLADPTQAVIGSA
jgi:hypothetical protein